VKRTLALRLERPELSARLPTRATLVCATLGLAIALAVCLATAFGYYPISPISVIQALLGARSHLDIFIVRDIRLPRILEGALAGAALGLSGAILQALTRNPLASPDILGINQGAAVVAVWLIVEDAPYNLVPIGAFAGASAVIAILALLGVRRRFSIYRLMLIGVGINAFCAAIVGYLLTLPIPPDRVVSAEQWLFGSVEAATWFDIRILSAALIVVVLSVALLSRQLNAFQLGPEVAVGLGVRPNLVQILLALCAAILAAVVVSVAGPIAFVAFVAPHIARRLTRNSSAASLPAAMGTGALVLLIADYAGKRLLEPTIELPVGITTVLIGAPYLLFLLYKNERDTGVA
jgi:iron complex transport system permease protein